MVLPPSVGALAPLRSALRLLPVDALARKLGQIVVSEHGHQVGVIGRDAPEQTEDLKASGVVSGASGGERGHGVLRVGKFGAEVVRVTDVQQPVAIGLGWLSS